MKIDPRLLDPALYRHSFDITPRFSDVDTLGHLNNARLTEFYQEARVSFYTGLERTHGLRRRPGLRFLVAHMAIDYLAEVNYPQPVTMKVAVAQLGRSSQTLAIALFSEGRCAGFARVVLVNADAEGPTPIPDELREALRHHLLPPGVPG